jgi:hypothetical protein
MPFADHLRPRVSVCGSSAPRRDRRRRVTSPEPHGGARLYARRRRQPDRVTLQMGSTSRDVERARSVAAGSGSGHIVGQYLYAADGSRSHSFADGREIVYVNHTSIPQHAPTSRSTSTPATPVSRASSTEISPPPSTTFFYHPDHLLSPHFTSIDDASLAEHVEYFASGEPEGVSARTSFPMSRRSCSSTARSSTPSPASTTSAPGITIRSFQNWQSSDPALPSYTGKPPGWGVHAAQSGPYNVRLEQPSRVTDTMAGGRRPDDPISFHGEQMLSRRNIGVPFACR